jgi:formate hydrogenlyase subunit 3/multisubunit Na+/H+ antiporter MnhD subunit
MDKETKEEKENPCEEMCGEMMKTKGLGIRFAISIISIVGWIIFLILWLFFYASNYDIYQNIAIIIVSLLILGGIKGVVWIAGRK